MALSKRTYVSGQTIITAENLNDIQDSIITLEKNDGVIPHIGDNGNWYIGSTDTGNRLVEPLVQKARMVHRERRATRSPMPISRRSSLPR